MMAFIRYERNCANLTDKPITVEAFAGASAGDYHDSATNSTCH